MHRRLALWTVLAALLAACGGDGRTVGPDLPEGVAVVSVVDGDTMRVLIDGADESVRLIGINAPEKGECLHPEATARLAELVGAGPVELEIDRSDRDQFGRLLRYVHVGGVFVNEAMVADGLAISRRYEPDTDRSDVLEAAQARAKESGAGVWGESACGPATGTAGSPPAVEVGEIHYDAEGDDARNLNDEWIELANSGNEPVDLTGWALKDESARHRFRFPSGFELAPGDTLRVLSGCGEDTATVLHWCSRGSAVWNNSGDTVFVLDAGGNVVASRTYSD